MGKAGVIAIAAAIALVVGLSLVERAADTAMSAQTSCRAKRQIIRWRSETHALRAQQMQGNAAG